VTLCQHCGYMMPPFSHQCPRCWWVQYYDALVVRRVRLWRNTPRWRVLDVQKPKLQPYPFGRWG